MSQNPFNAYDLLEINSNATEQEIKTAFKQKALEFHPDLHQNAKPANVLFTILVHAKDVLLNPERRLEHDYAQGIKQKPREFNETEYRNEPSQQTDWASLILAGVAGLAVGAALFNRRRRKFK